MIFLDRTLRLPRRAGTLALFAGLAVPGAAAQDYPKTPPPPGPLVAAPFPPFQEAVLPNGLRLLVVESHKQPIVSLSLSFTAGSATDPAGKEGLAEMVAGLLTKGAGQRTAEQIAEAIEGAGGSLSAGAGSDFLSVTSTVLTPSLPLAFSLLADVVRRPTFPDAEVELLRTQTLSGLQVALAQPSSIANRAFRKALYGDHPYARSALPASVRAITRSDVVAFHRARIRPRGALLVVAGDVTLARARALATRALGGWQAPAAAAPPPARAPAPRTATELLLVHRPGSVQSNILIGNLTWGPADPRHYAATVMNRVLGGGADSRLFLILREQKSWTYGAYSDLVRRRGPGFFVANAEVRTEVTDSALGEMLTQLRRIRDEAVPPEEFEAARGSLVGSYPLSIETAEQVAGAVANARLYGLPADYVQTYRVRLGRVTPAEAQAAAQAAIRPGGAVIVVVGDGEKIYERIRHFAPTRIVDPEGKPLTPEELSPKAVALDLDLAALVPRRDSFTVMVQGNAFGWQRGVLEETDGGFTYTETLSLDAAGINQTTTLTMDSVGGTRRVRQSGTMMGQDIAVDVAVEGGRARGTARAPDPTGQFKSVTIDTALAPGTIDDNTLQAVLPALRWTAGAKWTFSLLSASQGEVKPATVTVGSVETVRIGARDVETYRVDLTGGTAAFTFWVTTARPYTLVKIALVGQPLEFVRAN